MTVGFPDLASDAGRMGLRLAGFLADPLPSLAPDRRDSFIPAAILPLLGQPAARHAVAAHLASRPGAAILPRIATLLLSGPLSEAAQRMFAIALLPHDRLDPLLARLAAAIHAPRFRLALLKTERAALQALFGDRLSRFATEEGLSLLAPLGGLDDGRPFPEPTPAGLSAPDHPARTRAAEVLCAQLSQGADAAAALLWWRLFGTAAPTWPGLSPRQAACLAQLVARAGAAP
jgi:hypothetical protein